MEEHYRCWWVAVSRLDYFSLRSSTRTNAVLFELWIFKKDSCKCRRAWFYGLLGSRPGRWSIRIRYICAFRGFAKAIAVLYWLVKVVKVRLQLQGSYNNPAFFSGYNYKSTFHAIKTVDFVYITLLMADYSDWVPVSAVLRIPSNYASRPSI